MNEKHLIEPKVLIPLILRSPDIGEGWRKVSNLVREIIEPSVAASPELYETREEEDFKIRLSEHGEVLRKYL